MFVVCGCCSPTIGTVLLDIVSSGSGLCGFATGLCLGSSWEASPASE